MALFRRKSRDTSNEDAGPADGSARIVIVSLGGREDLLPDFAFELGHEPRVIGREEDCDIQIVDGQISRQHLRIGFDPQRGRHVGTDLKSANGTFVNDVRVESDVALSEGDVIHIGDSRLLFTHKRFKDHDGAMTYYRRTGERRRGTLMK